MTSSTTGKRSLRWVLVASSVLATVLFAAIWPGRSLAEEPHVLFFTKSAGFEHGVIREQDGQPSFAEKELRKLGERYGFRVTVTKDGSVFDRSLDDYDTFFFYTTGNLLVEGVDGGAAMSAKGKKRLLRAVEKQGKGFVGSHCATDTFHSDGDRFRHDDSPDPYIEMIGAEFITHGAQQKARMRVVDSSFPGLQALSEGFELHEEWYALKNFHPDLHVLLVQETEGMTGEMYQRPAYPATWIRNYGAGRVFYTSMGHREDVWTDPSFVRVLVGGILWTLRDSEADLSRNLERLTPGANLPIYPPKREQ